jgi:formylglycine-generating enzyme required for sulfatase activity/acetyl esterase/lipase
VALVLMLGQIGKAVAEEQNGMVLITARRVIVGTSQEERQELARRYDCHPTWLNDDLPRHEVALLAFWIDRYPVTNAQYLAFVEATGHPRPAWWNRWGGTFPSDYAEHPVVGVAAQDAAAYALWADKRLPTAEEWEAAVAGADRSLFAWGDAWPGPLKHVGQAQIFPDRPGTRPVGGGECGRSASGMEDFAGQTLEWVGDVRPHHGSQFRLLKGASWLHEDPVNFRVASSYFASENWQSAPTGLRCALDGDRKPPQVPKARVKTLPAANAASKGPASETALGMPVLAPGARGSRHLTVRVPKFDIEGIDLMAPETILWNRASVLSWREKPQLTWTERSPQRAVYDMQLPKLRVHAEFLSHEEYVEQRFTATNLSQEAGTFRSSSCFKLQSAPMFYDCEQLRTFAIGADGEFVPVRRLVRGGECVRWVGRFGGNQLGDRSRWALLAVVSRDGSRIIAVGQAGPHTEFSVGTNTLFTCLHSDLTAKIEAGGQTTIREVFWFLEGTREDLLRRFHQEFASAPRANATENAQAVPATIQEAAEIARGNAQEDAQVSAADAAKVAKQNAVSLQENSPRAPRPYNHKPDLENVAYGPHPRNMLDLWKANSDRPTPLVVFFHPGGFSLGDKTWISPTLLEACLDKGISVATVSYRYSFQAPWPAQVEDSARAIQFLRLHAQQWNLNPAAVAATGSSAGAGISLRLGFHDDQADPKSDDPLKRQSTGLCVLGFSNGQTTYDPREIAGVIGEENARKMGRMALATLFGLGKDEDVMKAAAAYPLFEDSSGLRHVKRGAPPVFMYYSTPLRPLTPDTPQEEVMHNIRFGMALKERMDNLGISCVLRNVDDYPPGQGARHQRDMVDFFLKHFPA